MNSLLLALVLVASSHAFLQWSIPGSGTGGGSAGLGGGAGPQSSAAWTEDYSPLPHPGSQVTHGPARFTVLTPKVIRMEWSPHTPPKFHDMGTFFAVNRRMPGGVVKFESRVEGGVLTLTTPALTLRYDPSASPGYAGFTRDTLSATLGDGRVWRHGDEAKGALHGTVRTLDRVGKTVGLGCSQPAYMNDSHCEEGVVSRDGWAVIDDSMGVRWDTVDYKSVDWPWVTGPAESPASAPGAYAPEERCAPKGFQRWECIWGNVVDAGACAAKGCCFDPVAAGEADGVPPAQHMTPWCFWPTPPAGTAAYTDLYLFGHGDDFTGAMKDFTGVGGKIPLMPRWALGPFFSRWFAYTDHEERGVLATHARNGIPLDVQVLDTDWHMGWWYSHGFPPHPPRYPTSTPPHAHAIQWTGWDVNAHLLPAVKKLHAYLHARGVATGWNFHLPPFVHMSGGVQYTDSVYRELCGALGLDADEGLPVLGDYSNKTWTKIFFKLALEPLLVGLDVDFAWPDWQQGEWTRMLGLPPTPWLSYMFASYPGFVRPPQLSPPQQQPPSLSSSPLSTGARGSSARSFVLNRWGGLGAHRYPVGFSGDAETTWEMLGLQIYITATAANVAFQWSHDIGGFAGSPDPELFTRWVQLGVFSPILRPHTAGRGGVTRDIWKFEWSSFEIMRTYFRLRARLIPYLYTAQRQAYATGVVPVHPLYYAFPATPTAYEYTALHQYFFGPSLWIAPVSEAARAGSGNISTVNVWFPPGEWIEWWSWQLHSTRSPTGGTYGRGYTLEETPVFTAPGGIVPLSGALDAEGGGGGAALGSAVGVPEDMVWYVFPPPPGAHFRPFGPPLTFSAPLYDDDGTSLAYTQGLYSWTNATCAWSRGGDGVDRVDCTISKGSDPYGAGAGAGAGAAGASTGVFPEAPLARSHTLRFISSWPPSSVTVGGVNAAYLGAVAPDTWGENSAWPASVVQGKQPKWTYHGDSASTWVKSPKVAWGSTLTFSLTFPTTAFATDNLLTSALARKISRAQGAKGFMNIASWTVQPCDVPNLLAVAGAGAIVEAAVGEAWGDDVTTPPAPKAVATMLKTVREKYGALGGELKGALGEVEALLAKGNMGAQETQAVENMKALIINALA